MTQKVKFTIKNNFINLTLKIMLKMFNKNYLKFEGLYHYDIKIKGRDYYCSGSLQFEGEFLLNSKYTGQEYDLNGNILN